MHREIFAGLALGVAAASCSFPESAPSDTIARWEIPTVPVEAIGPPETQPPLVYENNAETVELLKANAPIQIVYIPTSAEFPPYDAYSPSPRDRFLDTANHERAVLLGETLTDIAIASDGFYVPSGVTVVDTSGLPEIKCLNNEDAEQVHTIREYAAQSFVPQMINVILVDADPCPDISPFSGFASYGEAPVLAANSIGWMGDVIAHEVGHEGGLYHAGGLYCKDPITIENCEYDETGDDTSVMGYNAFYTTFTVAELNFLDLIDKSRVLTNPTDGVYTLSDVKSEQGLPALIELDSDAGKLYLSWEKDEQASSDVYCTPESGGTPPAGDSVVYRYIDVDEDDGLDNFYVCYKTNFRFQDHSLQVRVAGQTSNWYDLVSRTDRMPDDPVVDPAIAFELVNNTFTYGEVIAGSILYEDKDLRVIFVGTDELNNAFVKIERL